jgi:hypothetical protein
MAANSSGEEEKFSASQLTFSDLDNFEKPLMVFMIQNYW